MKSTIAVLILVLTGNLASAQFKSLPDKKGSRPLMHQLSPHPKLKAHVLKANPSGQEHPAFRSFIPLRFQSPANPQGASVIRDEDGRCIAVRKMWEVDGHRDLSGHVYAYLEQLKPVWSIREPAAELVITSIREQGSFRHIRLQQIHQGCDVYGGELIVHGNAEGLYLAQGHLYPTPDLDLPENRLSSEHIKSILVQDYEATPGKKVIDVPQWIPGDQYDMQTVIYHGHDELSQPVFAWYVTWFPNARERWVYFLDCTTGELLHKHLAVCSFSPDAPACSEHDHPPQTKTVHSRPENQGLAMLDGATITIDDDLFGVGREVNGYQVGNTYFLEDVSRSMFNPALSVMPNEPQGVIWTLDAQNTSPQLSNWSVSHVTSPDNTWQQLEVSAHYNASVAYSYFEDTFDRLSINKSGGNLISIINITDENGQSYGNAFWNGQYIGYGNGDALFEPLAKGLDVAGHEMSHGVIGTEANLEYIGQSGALNESFADIFGAMIDREDWQIGEDVVNPAVFTSGALRDLQNPNNGGVNPGDPGWQPDHMDAYQDLPLHAPGG